MKLRRTYAAFTLIELLVVIGIIGLLAALVGPTLTGFRKGDAMLAATRTMLDGVARARQLAISQHTTVYMVFVPKQFWDNSQYRSLNAFNNVLAAFPEAAKATNILEKQLTGFNFVSLRSIGDQPGNPTPHYLSSWQSLPDSAFIAEWKFNLRETDVLNVTNDILNNKYYPVYGFNTATNIPFPSEQASANPSLFPYVWLPYIAFDYQGRLVDENGQLLGRDEYIPLAHGSVVVPRDPVTKKPQRGVISALELPAGNSTNTAYNLIHIDGFTGRARLERQQVK